VESIYGHDAFLKEVAAMSRIITATLQSTSAATAW
jgi:hypothetical protein